MITPRLGLSVLLGGVVTLALFFLMQWLIAGPGGAARDDVYGQVIDFVRVRQDSETERRLRKPIKKLEKPAPKTPNIDVGPTQKPRLSMPTNITNDMKLGFQLAGGLDFGAAPSDADVIPLVRIEPNYPERALSRGIEGWVLLEFSITPQGTVKDVSVVDSDPPRIFDRAAERAVRKWKYRPRIEDGEAVTRTGVQIVLTFKMAE